MLLKLDDKVAYAVSSNFDKLPENTRNELLLKLADNKDAAVYVFDAIAYNFDKLPPNIQNLLFKLADNKDAAVYVFDAIADNFDKLPEKVRNELQKRLAKHGIT